MSVYMHMSMCVHEYMYMHLPLKGKNEIKLISTSGNHPTRWLYLCFLNIWEGFNQSNFLVLIHC